MKRPYRTVIISCAGMGNRLGLGVTKALLEVEGKPLIIRHLEMLDEEKDVRVVVGFQAEKVMKVVREYRNDILFVYNHDYQKTGTGASLMLAAQYAAQYILSLDGDLLVHPQDMEKILKCEGEFIGGGEIETEEPWLVQTVLKKGQVYGTGFSQQSGEYEWTGITQVNRERLTMGYGHVYQLLEPLLPIPVMQVRTREIDTINDYEKAVQWIRNKYQ